MAERWWGLNFHHSLLWQEGDMFSFLDSTFFVPSLKILKPQTSSHFICCYYTAELLPSSPNPDLRICILVNSLASSGGGRPGLHSEKYCEGADHVGYWACSSPIVNWDFPWLKIPLMLQTDCGLQKCIHHSFFY